MQTCVSPLSCSVTALSRPRATENQAALQTTCSQMTLQEGLLGGREAARRFVTLVQDTRGGGAGRLRSQGRAGVCART